MSRYAIVSLTTDVIFEYFDELADALVTYVDLTHDAALKRRIAIVPFVDCGYYKLSDGDLLNMATGEVVIPSDEVEYILGKESSK